MPVIGIPITPNDVTSPSRLIATPSQPTAPAICCDTFPTATEVPSVVSCAGQNVLAVEPTASFKQPLFGRIQTIRIQAGSQDTILWTMRNREGNPVKLTDCVTCVPSEVSSESSMGSDSETIVVTEDCRLKLKLRLREQLLLNTCRPGVAEFNVTVVDADLGQVQVIIPRTSTLQPGIYFGEIAMLGMGDDGEEYVYFSNTFMVAIEQGNWSGRKHRHLGPPTYAEIRLHLRDSNPAENLLLADLMFDDAEIALAIVRPIQYWNEIPPPIRTFTTQNFPYRYHWLEAIAGELFLMAAEGYRRNHLAYSAAGVSIDDQNKEQNYEQAADRRRQDWRAFVKQKKASLNLEDAYGAVGSGYAGRSAF